MTYSFTDEIRAFLQEKKYLQNVSSETIILYETSFKGFRDCDTLDQIKVRVVELRQRGLKPVTVNTYLRHMKTFFRWKGLEWKMPWLKEEQTILITFTPEQVTRIINGKTVGRNETRARMVALTALDTGMRIQEILNLRRSDLDFENLLFRVNGKGNKQRLVPMSIELRKLLFRYLGQHKFDRLVCTGGGTSPTQRNLSRDFKLLCSRLGITGVRASFHTLRHSFAVNYLKSGGNVIYLQRILGHASLEMTNRYTKSLGIEDLQKVHDGLSFLSR